jgi:hypothetical protein
MSLTPQPQEAGYWTKVLSDLLQFLHLKLEPTSSLATQNTYHTVREAGLQKTIALLQREYERGRREGQMTPSFQGYDDKEHGPAYHLTLVCHDAKTVEIYTSYECRSLRLNPGLGSEAFRLVPALNAQVPPARAYENTSP